MKTTATMLCVLALTIAGMVLAITCAPRPGKCSGLGCLMTQCQSSSWCGGDCVCVKVGTDPIGVCVQID